MKEDFFSKFKDYNKELEKILEIKDFSKDAKNLLLSMFYKLEICYEDYFIVKRNTKTKQEFLENILENIKTINNIEVIKPNHYNFEEIKKNGLCEVDLKFRRIKVLDNELSLLTAILELNNFETHLKEEYNLIRNSMPYLLNMAYDMENIEVLRDFNAWSWNTLKEEIKDIKVNLIYQNLRMALDKNIFIKLQNEDVDLIKYIEQTMSKLYNKEKARKFLELIFEISIMIYIDVSQNEEKRLLEERKTIELDLNEIKDKKTYVEKITEEKKKLTTMLKKIDLTINNKELLVEEYERRNKKLEEYNKIFSLSHLVDKLQKERGRILSRIEVCNKKIDPKIYLLNRNKLQEDYNLLKNIDSKKNIYGYIDELQEIFITDIFINKINLAKTRNEIIDCMYELRYYNFLPYNDIELIKDVEYFDVLLERAKEVLIEKLYNNKIINNLSSNLKNDIEIVKNIFDLKIINMEYIYIEIRKEEQKYIIQIYDEKETLEKQIEMNLEFNPKDKIKLNRRIKLFI